ncbi:MAG: hypothetical protein ACRDSO_04725 [Pseudonocardiaceae bacterium]
MSRPSSSRIALIANGLHYPTDVVAGFCAALAIVLVLGLDSIGPSARRRSAPGIP